MKFFKLIFLLSLILFCSFFSYSQYGYHNDAIRFGQTFTGGSARIQSLGSVNTSLGGDVSSISRNPAGLGFFNSNVLSFTANSSFLNSSSLFRDESSNSSTSNLGFDNLGVVFAIGKKSFDPNCSDCIKFNVGIGYNRINDFKESVFYNGFNNNNSIIDYFLKEAQGIPISQIGNSNPVPGLELIQEAYDHYLINPEANDNLYYSFISGFPFQEEIIYNEGNQNQLSFSIGGNYQDNVFFGASLIVNSIYFDQERLYTENQFEIFENDKWSSENILDYLSLEDRLLITGSGISSVLGFIIKPSPSINFGISYSTKTNYRLKEESFSTLKSNYFNYYFASEDTILSYSQSSTPNQNNRYTLTTPGKLSLGTTIFIKKYGFISADIDFVNYSISKIKSDGSFDASLDNDVIADIYRPTSHYRIGAEARIKNHFYFRAGYQLLDNPYDKDLEYMYQYDKSRSVKTLGIGYMRDKLSIDISYRREKKDDRISPYSIGGTREPIAKINYYKNSIIFSLGFKFINY